MPPLTGQTIHDGQLTEAGAIFMPRSIRALTGMPVVFTETGARVGRVTRVYVDEALTRITGIWVSGRLGRLFFCPESAIEMIGEVSVLVRSHDKCPSSGVPFRMRRAIDSAGQLIGAAVGAYFEPETLAISSIELTRGFWEDITRGREEVRNFAVRLPQGDVAVTEGEEKADEDGTD